MLSLKAHWINAGKDVSAVAKHVAELRYAQWMEALVEGDLEFLRNAYNKKSRHHGEYVVFDVRARVGIASFMPPHEAGHAAFTLEFEDK